MANWIQNCQICNDGLCIRMEELKKTSLSERQAAEVMQEEALDLYPQLKKEFAADKIRMRYRYHMKGRKVEEILPPEASWPICKKCGKLPVIPCQEGNSCDPHDSGLCRTCITRDQYQKKQQQPLKWACEKCGQKGIKPIGGLCAECRRNADYEKLEEQQAEIDRQPNDTEVEEFWTDYISKFHKLLPQRISTGKVGPEVLEKLKEFEKILSNITNRLHETIWSSQAFEKVA